MKQLGCSTMLYRNFSLEQALAGIRQAGGYAIELCARSSTTGQIAPLDLNRHDDVDGHYQEVKQAITAHGLKVESIAISGQQISQPAGLERLIEASCQLKTDTVVVNSGGVGSGLGVGACELDGAEVGWITGAGLIVWVGFLFVTADGAGVGSAGSAGFGTGGLDRLATQALISGE